MAKYDNLHPVKAKLLRRYDRQIAAYNKAMKARDGWARVPNKTAKMQEHTIKLETELKKARDAADKTWEEILAWEVSDER